jgi:hypothetical protein
MIFFKLKTPRNVISMTDETLAAPPKYILSPQARVEHILTSRSYCFIVRTHSHILAVKYIKKIFFFRFLSTY